MAGRAGKNLAEPGGQGQPAPHHGGHPGPSVANNFKPRYFDVAEDLVNEALSRGCDTIIMGRRGLGAAKSLLLGSFTNKVVQNSRGLAVTIVT